jgi:thiol:disulfide interchange protein DsbC
MTIKTFGRRCAVLALTFISFAASADEAAIRKALAERLPPEAKVDSVKKMPMLGLYEVIVGSDIVYTDASGKYLIMGNIQDLKSGQNFTQERSDALAGAEVYKPENLKNALKLVKGDGSRKMVVFEDANCGYCKKLRAEMEKLNNVTIYTYLVPILSEDSATKMRGVWCAKDRNKAYDDWMLLASPPPAADSRCDVPIEANMGLARNLKVNGTPAIFFASGKRVPGYIEMAQLEAGLSDTGGSVSVK